MIKVNIHEVKTHFSEYLEKVAKGKTVVVCRRNVPIAELRPLPKPVDRRALYGLDKGKVILPPEFFDPLPDDILKSLEGM